MPSPSKISLLAALTITGGTVGRGMDVSNLGEVTVAGGSIGDEFATRSRSSATFVGGEFLLDGTPIAGLETPGDTVDFNLPDGSILSGVLGDGTPFALSSGDRDSLRDGTVTLRAAALPPIQTGIITVP